MKRKVKKGGDIITDSITRHPPSLCLSFKRRLQEDLTFSLRETHTLSAAKLDLRLGLRSDAAAKFCRVGSHSKRKKHDVSKDAQI